MHVQIAEERDPGGRLVRAGLGRGRRIGIRRRLRGAAREQEQTEETEASHDPTVPATARHNGGMRRALLTVVLLAGCPAFVDPPIPFAEPADLAFLTAPGELTNPVTFTVEAADEIVSVTYIADGWFTLGSSEDRDTAFAFGMDFAVLGAHTIAARGFDAEGDFVASAELAIDVLPDPTELNAFGAWLHAGLLDHADFTHDGYAARLADIGVKRAYIEVGEGEPDCASWPDLCDHDVSDAWRGLGVEPWIWMRADASIDGRAQAETIRDAVTAGYQGIVVDIAAEYADDVDGVQDLLAGLLWVRSQCDTTGLHLGGNFPIYVTTSVRPDTMGLPLSSMNAAVDAYLPRTDMASWQAEPGSLAEELVCGWTDAGATKPVHPVVDLLVGTPLDTLDPFTTLSGRETSLYRVPLPDATDAAWDDYAAMDWWGGSFSDPDCG